MKTRFKKKINIFNVAVTAISGMLSVSIMFYAVGHFGLSVAWPELVLNTFYVASLVNEAAGYLMTEIWIRPTITYGLVACFVTETNEK